MVREGALESEKGKFWHTAIHVQTLQIGFLTFDNGQTPHGRWQSENEFFYK